MIKIIPLVIGSVFGAGTVEVGRKEVNITCSDRHQKVQKAVRKDGRKHNKIPHWAE